MASVGERNGGAAPGTGLRAHFERRLGQVRQDRSTWLPKWAEAAEYLLPEYSRFFSTNVRNRGDASFKKILDAEGSEAIQTSAEGIMNVACNEAKGWYVLTHPDRAKKLLRSVKSHLHDCTQLMLEAMSGGNFYDAALPLIREYLVFGTPAAHGDSDDKHAVCWYNFVPGEYSLGADARGNVNICYREYMKTAPQLVDQFGKENLSEHAKRLLRDGDVTTGIEVVHAIEPSDGMLRGVDERMPRDRYGNRAKYRSVTWERGKDRKDDLLLRVRGYFEFPVMAPQLGRVGQDTYGYGLGMRTLLGDVKELQFLMNRRAKIIDRIADPTYKAPVSMRDGMRGTTLPGGIMWYPDSVSADGFKPLYEIPGNPLGALDVMIADLRERIRAKAYANVFTQFTDMDNKTDLRAEQVSQLSEEKLQRMGGVIRPLNNGFFAKAIDRYWSEMNRQGMLPEAPEEIAGDVLTVEYRGIFAQAQKAHALTGINRLFLFAGQIAKMKGDPGVFDKLDADTAIDDAADALGTPPKLVVPTKDAAAVRGQRMHMQQAATAAAAARDAAGAAQQLSQTKADPDSYLEQITSGYAAAGN